MILNYHNKFRYKIITDISCTDFIIKKKRFEINYNLLSIDYNSRILISIHCDKYDSVESLSNLYKGCN